MRVLIPTALRSYTGDAGEVAAEGGTIGEAIADLDRRFPGFRFRIIDEQNHLRPHIRVTINLEVVDGLDNALKPDDLVAIIMAFSGG